MKEKKINNPVVLVAPLDWGLGHATRCVPIITQLLEEKCRVIIAASGSGKILLQKEFPGLEFLELGGYRVRYSRNEAIMSLMLFLQVPRVLSAVYAEHRWLKRIIKEYAVDAVISDNRFGLFCKTAFCIYITHQLKIKTGGRFTEWLARKIHYWFINKFNECWVPDTEKENGLAGELSHPKIAPVVPVKYIGPLSRFEKNSVEKKYDLAVILSGPEPQRTVFEELVLKDLGTVAGNIILVRGVPGGPSLKINFPASVEIKDHLTSGELNRVILQSRLIVSRSGYSTIMDLVKLQQKAILVPTPGQTEQEYLAGHLSQQRIFCCTRQADFSLSATVTDAGGFPFAGVAIPQNTYKQFVENFVDRIRNA